MLARATGRVHGRQLITWHIKSTTKAHQGLYEYDAVSPSLRDPSWGTDKVARCAATTSEGKLWVSLESQSVLLD